MALETGSYIDDLNSANPTAGDYVSQGDDHLRLTKRLLKNSLPSLTAPVILGYLADSGAANSITLTMTPAPPSTLPDGAFVRFKANATNTGACTITLNSSQKDLKLNGADVPPGAITADRYYEAVYDGTEWNLLGSETLSDVDLITFGTLTDLGNLVAGGAANNIDWSNGNIQIATWHDVSEGQVTLTFDDAPGAAGEFTLIIAPSASGYHPTGINSATLASLILPANCIVTESNTAPTQGDDSYTLVRFVKFYDGTDTTYLTTVSYGYD